jgi:ankyrin repeat protein
MEAKIFQNLPELKKYLEEGGNPNARDRKGRTLLHYAVKREDVDAFCFC